MKKIFLLITIIAIGLLSCGKDETASTETSVSQSSTQNAAQQSQENNGDKSADTTDFPDESNEEYPGGMAKGMDQEFATDGSLHEEQFLNKTFGYTDTSDSFKIQKDSNGYFLTKYLDESAEAGKEMPVKEQTIRLKLVKDVFLVEEEDKDDGILAYAYDTNLKKMVFINPYNKFRIMLVAD